MSASSPATDNSLFDNSHYEKRLRSGDRDV